MAAPTYIISRVADPIFAVCMGLGATALRISREEKEKGKTTADTVQSLKKRLGLSKPSTSFSNGAPAS